MGVLQLLGLRKESSAAIVASLPEKPAPRLVVAPVAPLGAYEKIAQEIGFFPAALLHQQLMYFLAKHEIQTYDMESVRVYMTGLAQSLNKTWVWRTLRDRDRRANFSVVGTEIPAEGGGYYNHGYYTCGSSECRSYDKLIPAPILRRVKLIETQFPNKFLFFVSDYADPHPDPFIMLTAEDVPPVVFGVWDEPGFGLKDDGSELVASDV